MGNPPAGLAGYAAGRASPQTGQVAIAVQQRRWFNPQEFVMQADHHALSPATRTRVARAHDGRHARSLRTGLATAWLAALALGGCMVGPDYQRPTVAVPAQFKEAAPGWKTAQPNDMAARGPWWEVFNDQQLDALETRVNQANQTVAGFVAA